MWDTVCCRRKDNDPLVVVPYFLLRARWTSAPWTREDSTQCVLSTSRSGVGSYGYVHLVINRKAGPPLISVLVARTHGDSADSESKWLLVARYCLLSCQEAQFPVSITNNATAPVRVQRRATHTRLPKQLCTCVLRGGYVSPRRVSASETGEGHGGSPCRVS